MHRFLGTAANGDRIFLGHDTRLDRDVWLHLHAVAANAALSWSDGGANLRLLATGESADLRWSAFEAPTGVALGTTPMVTDWDTAARCLVDLARELAREPDRSLALAQVFVDGPRVRIAPPIATSADGADLSRSYPVPQLFAEAARVFFVRSASQPSRVRGVPLSAEALVRRIAITHATPLWTIPKDLERTLARTTPVGRRHKILRWLLAALIPAGVMISAVVEGITRQGVSKAAVDDLTVRTSQAVGSTLAGWGIVAVVVAFLLGNCLSLQCVGLTLRSSQGAPASRLRAVWCCVVGFVPIAIAATLLASGIVRWWVPTIGARDIDWWRWSRVGATVLVLAYLIGRWVRAKVRQPGATGRSLVDRIAGVEVVPR